MGYDVEFIQVRPPGNATFPLTPAQAEPLMRSACAFAEPDAIREALLAIPGCKPAAEGAVDYVGRGLSYARFIVRNDRIHVENNCSAGELLKVFESLVPAMPGLVILDLQSRQLHTAETFAAWWSRPL